MAYIKQVKRQRVELTVNRQNTEFLTVKKANFKRQSYPPWPIETIYVAVTDEMRLLVTTLLNGPGEGRGGKREKGTGKKATRSHHSITLCNETKLNFHEF